MNPISRAEAKLQGLSNYFTGKPCKHGHISQRKTTNGGCIECERIWANERREENPAHSKEIAARYRAKNKERILREQREHRRNNPELTKMYRARYAEKSLIQTAKYRQENKERIREYSRKYYIENRAKRCSWEQNRRAAKKSSGKISDADVVRLKRLQRGLCATCETKLNKYHIDHTIPLSLGGLNTFHNIQLLCPHCNLKKNSKHPVEWANLNGKLL